MGSSRDTQLALDLSPQISGSDKREHRDESEVVVFMDTRTRDFRSRAIERVNQAKIFKING